jgi:hypothetical protein
MTPFSVNAKAASIAVAAGAALVAVGLWTFSGPPARSSPYQPTFDPRVVDSYDWGSSRRNLEAIGTALQAYRADYEVKPPAKRKSCDDAGLPPIHQTPVDCLRVPKETWFVKGAKIEVPHLTTSFQLIWRGLDSIYKPEELRSLLGARGDDLPVIADLGMYSGSEYISASKQHALMPILILRLNGHVDKVMFIPGDYKDLFSKK